MLDEARNANMAKTVEVLYDFTKEINTLAQERISFLNHADLEQVKAINTHYDDLIRDINEEQKNYVLNTMPNLFEKANSLEIAMHKMYYSIIDQSSANFVESINKRIDNATKNQRMIIEYNNELKSMIIGQTQLLVQETMANAKNLFNTSNVFSQINKDIKSSLTYDKQEALPDKSKKE